MNRAANGAICGPCRACMAERDALKAALVLETERCGEWATNAAMWAAERDELRFRLTKQQEARAEVEAERDALKAEVERLQAFRDLWATADGHTPGYTRDLLDRANAQNNRLLTERDEALAITEQTLWHMGERNRELHEAGVRIGTLEAALRKYSDHLPNCRRWTGHAEGEGTPWTDPTRPCTCGLDAALAGGG